MAILRTLLVSEEEFWREFARLGGVYFIRDDQQDSIKIGYTRSPWTRMSNLQVGSASRLTMVGLVAAPRAVEPIIHNWFPDGRRHGEWFWDRGVLTPWLMEMTHDQPMCRNVWTLVPGQEVFWSWNETTKSHTKHVLNKTTGQWEPPLP